LVRKFASSIAELPRPITASGLFLNIGAAPSHTTRRYATVPETIGAVAGAREAEPLHNGSGGNDHGVGDHSPRVGGDLEGVGGEVDLGDRLGEDLRAEPERLVVAAPHELHAEDSLVPYGSYYTPNILTPILTFILLSRKRR